jgi:hypoxanthine phosphoribosyltransferase
MTDFPKCRRTGWDDADRWADDLAAQITKAGRVPETLVALTRGGWVPARLIADRLGLKRMVSIRAQHWGVTATRSGKAELTEGLSGPVDGQTVLVVDDITDTGQSLALATANVTEHGAARVESATCLYINHATFRPTYFAEEIDRDHWVWVVFPWNYWEDLRTLAKRAYDETHDIDRSTKLLDERCGLSTTSADVARALELPKLRTA